MKRLTQIIEVREDHDEFKANATNEIFDTDGRLIEILCATAIGRSLRIGSAGSSPTPFSRKEHRMKLRIQLTTLFAFTRAGVLVGFAGFTTRGEKEDGDDVEASKIAQGFIIAPVPLNLRRKNRALVGVANC